MVELSKSIARLIVEEYGHRELLRRLADPFWFQCWGNVLGFDWHSSGLTTTSMGALKLSLSQTDLGIYVAGGKGRASRRTPQEIVQLGERLAFSDRQINRLIRASRLAAKVDNAVLQDNYQLYHHTFIISERGDWTVVQQGLCPISKTARRYHWLSTNFKSFVEEPHTGIITDAKRRKVIDLTDLGSEETRRCSLDLAKEGPRKLVRQLNLLRVDYKNSLLRFLKGIRPPEKQVQEKILMMPRQVNWAALQQAVELKPANYEELIGIKGLGLASIRALALVSHLVYGTKLSWKDPPRYSFAHGGKDAVPYKLNKKLYDKTIEILEAGINEAKMGHKEKIEAIKRLKNFLKP
jgi:hypothetical protein